MILKGKKAKYILDFLLENFAGEGRNTNYPVTGFFKEGNKYTCFDNTGGSCFVEQAEKKEKAIKWCLKKIDTIQLYKKLF